MATQQHNANPSTNNDIIVEITHHPFRYTPATPPDYKYVHSLYYSLKDKVMAAEDPLASIEYAAQALLLIGICDDVEDTARQAVYELCQTLKQNCLSIKTKLYGKRSMPIVDMDARTDEILETAELSKIPLDWLVPYLKGKPDSLVTELLDSITTYIDKIPLDSTLGVQLNKTKNGINCQ
ncbi:MAG: hypothetical protein V3U57_00315 [Robiginitomaculum sp.]